MDKIRIINNIIMVQETIHYNKENKIQRYDNNKENKRQRYNHKSQMANTFDKVKHSFLFDFLYKFG